MEIKVSQICFANSRIKTLVKTMIRSYIDVGISGVDADPGQIFYTILMCGFGLEIESQSFVS